MAMISLSNTVHALKGGMEQSTARRARRAHMAHTKARWATVTIPVCARRVNGTVARLYTVQVAPPCGAPNTVTMRSMV